MTIHYREGTTLSGVPKLACGFWSVVESHSSRDEDRVTCRECIAVMNRPQTLARVFLDQPELERLRQENEALRDRERSICEAVGGVCDGGQYRNDIIEKLRAVFAENEALRASAARTEHGLLLLRGIVREEQEADCNIDPKELESILSRLGLWRPSDAAREEA